MRIRFHAFHRYIHNTAKDVGIAVCGQIKANAQSEMDIEFVLAWDMPRIHFHKKIKQYSRWVQ